MCSFLFHYGIRVISPIPSFQGFSERGASEKGKNVDTPCVINTVFKSFMFCKHQ